MLRFLIIHVRNLSRISPSVPSSPGTPASEPAGWNAGSSAPADSAPRAIVPGPAAAAVSPPTATKPNWSGEGRGTPPVVFPTSLPVMMVVCLGLCAGCACLRREAHDASIVAGRQLSLRGIDAQQCGNWAEAQRLFAEALRKNPADERAHCHYAQVLWQLQQQEAAIQHLEESVRLSGGDPQLLVQLGQMYLGRGNHDAAWECAEEAVATNRHLAAAWALRGDVLRCRQQWDAALESYHRALSEQPQYPDVQLATAEVYRAQNRPRRALATLECLESQFRPQDAPTALFYEQGLAYKALGRYRDAVAAFTLASQQTETSADVYFQLAESQWLAGNSASARLAVQAALQRVPNHLASLQLRDRIDRQDQKLTAAVKR